MIFGLFIKTLLVNYYRVELCLNRIVFGKMDIRMNMLKNKLFNYIKIIKS